MRIAEAIFRQIIKEEARRVLSEETIVAGFTIPSVSELATLMATSLTKNYVVGQATGLAAVPSPVALEAGAITFSAPAIVPYLAVAVLISSIVFLFDAAYNALDAAYNAYKAIYEAGDRNTATAISQAKVLMYTAGVNAGKQQGIFSSGLLATFDPSRLKFINKQALSAEDKKNIAIVFSMLTSADIDKAFSDAKQAVISRGSSKINDEIYNTTIEDFKTKLAAMQQAVMEGVARLKVNQLIQQTTAQQAKERQTPAAQAAEQARLATLGREADKADFARGIVPASYKPVKR